jgi:dTDP-4-dehydrorhamnose reductase
MLQMAREEMPIRVVDDQRCTPSYTVDVAEATAALIGIGAMGLYHVTNAGFCTWYDLAREIFDRSGLKPNLTSIASAELGTFATRPSFSVLFSANLAARGLPTLRSWADALGAYLIDRKGYRA